MKRILMLFLFILIYSLNSSVKSFFDYELNYAYVSSFTAGSLYNEESFVSSGDKLLVKDFLYQDDKLYIFPITEEIKLPIGGMISKVKEDYVEIVDLNHKYKIYHFNYVDCLLYQYKKPFTTVGKTNDFFIIESDNITSILNNIEIEYVKV